MNLQLDQDECLWNEKGEKLDPWHWRWSAPGRNEASDAKTRQAITLRDAVKHVYGSGSARILPVGVIGPNEPSDEMIATARQLGAELARLNLTILCGGRGGVMEAASRGARGEGGQVMGFLRGADWRDANDFITIPLATGIGHARNALIAQSSIALVAVGGQYGTYSEAAFGLNFGKQVFGLCHAPDIEGVQHKDHVDEVIDALLPIVLHCPDLS